MPKIFYQECNDILGNTSWKYRWWLETWFSDQFEFANSIEEIKEKAGKLLIHPEEVFD